MNKTYVALRHFKDAEIGLITRRQLFTDLSEDKISALTEKGVIRLVVKPEVPDLNESFPSVLVDGEATIDSIGLSTGQQKVRSGKSSKKRAASGNDAE